MITSSTGLVKTPTYHSLDRVVEAEHESADGGLPCTRLPDDGGGRSRLNKERYASKTAVTVVVAKKTGGIH